MATLRELIIEIGVDADLETLDKMEKGLDDIKKIALGVGVALAGVATSLFALAKSAANYADTIEDTADIIGFTNEELQTLAHAAQLSGSNLEQASNGMRDLNRNLANAATGAGPAHDALSELGLSAIDSGGKLKTANQVMIEIADKFKDMENGAKKTKISMDLMGESGVRLIPMLNAGSAGIEDMRQEARDLGLVLDEKAIRAGSDFNDSLDRLMAVFGGLKNSIGAAVIPALMEMVDALREIVVANFDVIRSGISKFLNGFIIVVRNVTAFIGFMASGFSKLADIVGGIMPLLKTIAAIFGAFLVGKTAMAVFDIAKGFGLLAKMIKLVNVQALLIPILIGAAVLLVIAIVDDLIAFMEGRPSFLGYLIANKDEILATIMQVFEQVKQWLNQAFEFLFNMIEQGIAAFFEFFGVPADEAQTAAKAITDAFRAAFEFIKGILGDLLDVYVTVFGDIVEGIRPIIADIVDIINEPMLIFEKLPGIIEGVFELALKTVSRFLSFAISSLLKLVGVPDEKIGEIVESIQNAFNGVIDSAGNVVNFITDAFIKAFDIIKDVADTTIGGVAKLINFFGGGDEAAAQKTRNESIQSAGQSIQNNVTNQAASSSVTVSPNITITQTAGDTQNNEDLAARIRDELTNVAQGVGRANKPQFAQ